MNIERIRENIEKNKGKTVRFKFNGTRNQTEEFEAVIENTYNYVFVVRLEKNKEQRKSFSYSDVLTENLEIFVE